MTQGAKPDYSTIMRRQWLAQVKKCVQKGLSNARLQVLICRAIPGTASWVQNEASRQIVIPTAN